MTAGRHATGAVARWVLAVVVVTWLLPGCQGSRERNLGEAAAAGLVLGEWAGRGFRLATWTRAGQPGGQGESLSLYIEGDGYAWMRPDRPSQDPTPRHPVALALAARDPATPLVYLARPCQFIRGPECTPDLWTHRRFSPEVVAALDAAITELMRAHGTRRLRLVGYSGGGVLAALVAAGRVDVEALVTLAAPLDLDAWTSLHRVSPFPGWSSPVHHAEALRQIPQLHLVGEDDSIVPAEVVRAYLRKVRPLQGTFRVVPKTAHTCCWEAQWPGLLQAWEAPPGMGLSLAPGPERAFGGYAN